MNERDNRAPMREAFLNPDALLRERDAEIVQYRWRCKDGHTFIVEGDEKPAKCPICTAPQDVYYG